MQGRVCRRRAGASGLSSRRGRRSMPHVRRSMLIWVEADTERVRHALTDDLDLVADGDANRAGFAGPIAGMPDTSARLVATIVDSAPGTTQVQRATTSDVRVPFFTWFLRFQAWLGAKRALP